MNFQFLIKIRMNIYGPALCSNDNSSVAIFSLCLWLYSPTDLGRFFSFLIIYTVGTTPWTRDQLVAKPLPTHRRTQTQNKRTQISMPLVGFEHKTPVIERVKTVHTLNCATNVIGASLNNKIKNIFGHIY
jgi:hypothetical protein